MSNNSNFDDTSLYDFLKKMSPHIPAQFISEMTNQFRSTMAKPLSLLHAITHRLGLPQESAALFSLLNSQSTFSKIAVRLLLMGFKRCLFGRTPLSTFYEPRPLAAQFDLKSGCEFLHNLINNSDTPEDIKLVLINKKHIAFLRNIFSQDNFIQSFEQLTAMLPLEFQDNMQSFYEEYNLESLSAMGKHLLPHFNDEELSKIIARLPKRIFKILHTRINNFILHLGDPENNLVTIFERHRQKTLESMETVFQKGLPQFQYLVSADIEQFIYLLKSAKIFTDSHGNIAASKLTALLYEHDKLLHLTNVNSRFDQLHFLLAEMRIPQDLSTRHTLIPEPAHAHEWRHNLMVLKTAISRHRIHEEIYKTARLLLPAAEDIDQENIDTDPHALNLQQRKGLLSAFFQGISRGMQLSELSSTDSLQQENTDLLWSLTKDLIAVTDRTIIIFNSQSQPIINNAGQSSQLIFMENGSCVDEDGQILPKGDLKNLALHKLHNITQVMQNKQIACRLALRQLIELNLPKLIKMLSDYPTKRAFHLLLEQALLPRDVQDLLANLIDQLIPDEFRSSEIGQYAVRGMQYINAALIKSVIHKIPDALIDRLAGQVTRLVDDMDPYEQMPFFKNFTDKLVISLGENQSVQAVANVLTKGYYKAICLKDKRAMSEAVLSVGCPKTDLSGEVTTKSMQILVGAMTQSGGPAFQKAMQLFKGDIQIKSIREALNSMNSEVKPLPLHEIQQIIEQDLKKVVAPGEKFQKFALVNPQTYKAFDPGWPSHETLKTTQLNRLGSATIAQVHKAYLWQCVDGVPQTHLKPIVTALKVQRPMIAHRIQREMHAIQDIPDITESASSTLKELERSIVAETSFAREYQFGQLLHELYDQKNSKVSVIGMLGHGERLLIQKFSSGKSIDSLWAQKSAYLKIYFSINQHPEFNPAIHIEINKNHQVTGLNIITQNNKSYHPLHYSDSLTRTLQEYHTLYGQTPSFTASLILIDQICDYLNIQPLPKALSLPKQAEFLHITGQSLHSLIGLFANAAFNGIADKAYTLEINEKLLNSSKEHRRKVFLQYIFDSKKQIWHWHLTQYNPDGILVKHWDSSLIKSHKEKELLQSLNTLLHMHSSQPDTDWKLSIRQLSMQKTGYLNNLVRELLDENILFTGESFIDSDRHDGNLLFEENIAQNGQLLGDKNLNCIDTGAGTIVTQYEREGMIKLASGIAFYNVDILMQGLQQLIPIITFNSFEKNRAIKEDLKKSIIGEFIEREKALEIYQFLVTNSLIEINSSMPVIRPSDRFFHDLMTHPTHEQLRKRVFSFDTAKSAQESVKAIMIYVNLKRSTQDLPTINISHSSAQEFAEYLEKFDYGRVFSIKKNTYDFNPKNWFTDGHNSLLFIKSIRKIANVLETHNIYAPETIIQLNRGTKFIEDQLKKINIRKEALKTRIEELDKENPGQKMMTSKIKQELQPVNLGEAYIQGMLSTSLVTDAIHAIGWNIIPAAISWFKIIFSRLFVIKTA